MMRTIRFILVVLFFIIKEGDKMKVGDNVTLTKENFKDVMSHMHTTDTMFMNSQCLFVEYYDIIKSPWFILLTVIHQNERIRPIIDTSRIEGLDTNELFEWYCKRENRNFLLDLATAPTNKIEYNLILDVLMENEIFYTVDTKLNAVDAILTALRQKMVKKVVIYTEKENKFVREDIQRIFGAYGNVKYWYGDFKKNISKLPDDSSYMLSDFNKIVSMADAEHLNYASLILPYDYDYNFIVNEDGSKAPIVDMNYLGKDFLFKVAYFNACMN